MARKCWGDHSFVHLLGCQLLELVIGEHRKQRGDRVDGQLVHPAYATSNSRLLFCALPAGTLFLPTFEGERDSGC